MAERDAGPREPGSSGAVEALTRDLLERPDDSEVWARFCLSPGDQKRRLVQLLKERIDGLVRSEPQNAILVADILLKALGEVPGEAALIRRARGVALYFGGRTQEARDEFLESARAYDGAGEGIEAARMRRNLVEVNLSLGRSDEALECAQEARRVFADYGREDLLAELEINVGNIYFRKDEHVRAREHYSAAREGFRRLGNEKGLAFAEFGLANVETAANRFEQAEEAFLRARTAWQNVGSRAQVADCDYSLAILEARRGRFAEALRGFEAARKAYADGSKPSGEFYVDLDEADLYFRLGAWRDTLRLASRAADGFARLGFEYERSRTLALAGLARLRLGEHESAMRDLEAAAGTFRRLGNRTQGAVLDLHTSAAEIERGRAASVLGRLEEIDADLGRSGQHFLHELSSVVLAVALTTCGRAQDALRVLAPLVAPDRERTPLTSLTLAEALQAFGQAKLALGLDADATSAFQRAVDETEASYAGLPGHDLRLAFFRDRREAFCELVWLFSRDADPEANRRALEFLERSRMRSLADRQVEPSGRGAEFDRLRERLDVLLTARLDAELGTWSKGSSTTGRAPDEPELARLQDELARRARDGSASAPTALRWRPEVLRRAVGEDEVVLNYFVGPRGGVVLVSDHDAVEAVHLDHDFERVMELHEKLLFQLQKVRLGEAYLERRGARVQAAIDRVLDELGTIFLAPVAERISDRDLVIVPYGTLHGLPFHAFRLAGRYLVESSAIAYAPSMTTLARCREHRPTELGRMVAVAEAEASIPEVRREIENLRRLYGPRCLVMEPEEFRSRITSLPSDVRAVHAATHGSFEPEHPLFSGVRLGAGVLTAYDLRRMRLGFDLVTLSGCETGRQRVVAGEDLSGLQHALLAAGVASLMSALWPVADRQSADLMEGFYSHLAAGDSVRTSLARAQRARIAEGWQPAFWAPFVLAGNPDVCFPAT